MKRFIIAALTAALFTVPAFAENSVTVYSNGNLVEDSGIIVDGRTLVPVRGVFEYLGYEVDWDSNRKTATLTSGNGETVITLTAGENTFTVNDAVIVPDVPQQIIDGRFMLPLRAVGEAADGEIEWNSETKTASITIEQTVDEKSSEEDNDISIEIDENGSFAVPGVTLEAIDPSEADGESTNEIIIE